MDETTQKQVDDVRSAIAEQIEVTKIEELLRNNVFEFGYQDRKYRLRKPTFTERQSLYTYRLQKYTQLLGDETYLLEADLKKLYAKRGVDIDAFKKQVTELDKRKDDLYLKLGDELTRKPDAQALQLLRDEIESLVKQQQELIIREQLLMEYSIEHQVMLSVYYHAIQLVAEVEIEGTWIRLYPNQEAFDKHDDERLFAEFATRVPLLFRHELEFPPSKSE